MSLYPLKFKPRFVEKIWGGRKLETVLGKSLPPNQQIGESWELYDFPPGVLLLRKCERAPPLALPAGRACSPPDPLHVMSTQNERTNTCLRYAEITIISSLLLSIP